MVDVQGVGGCLDVQSWPRCVCIWQAIVWKAIAQLGFLTSMQDWQKISSVKKFNRFRPPEVIEAVKKLEMAKERLQASADTAYSELLGAISDLYRPFRSAASALAALDALQSFALVAHNAGYGFSELCK